MKKKLIKRNVPGSTGELAAKPYQGGNIQAHRVEYYAAEELGVKAPRDVRAVGNPPWERQPRKDRGKEFLGPGRRRDPDDAS